MSTVCVLFPADTAGVDQLIQNLTCIKMTLILTLYLIHFKPDIPSLSHVRDPFGRSE